MKVTACDERSKAFSSNKKGGEKGLNNLKKINPSLRRRGEMR
jgi:hypothetical protein